MDASILYFPSAVALGALHALEPGHAKTLTAAYLIGTHGTRRDALLLGLSVTATHSILVVLLALGGTYLGREAFTDRAMYWLQIISGAVVIVLGAWLLLRRLALMKRQATRRQEGHDHDLGHAYDHEYPHAHGADAAHSHTHAHDHLHAHHGHDHEHSHEHRPGHSHAHSHSHSNDHAHDDLDEDAHARAHAATLPDYVRRGERPSAAQVIAFGAAGGLIPCPAAVTVMLLAIATGKVLGGLLVVLGFSIGLAITLVIVGMAVVSGLKVVGSTGRFAWTSRSAPLLSAALVMVSGLAAILISTISGGHGQ
ncbi:MAG: sulfite exporter TauE/SafE family protein [Phycisphaerales bacterium]|nr:sulfite exporter TauE/SafE family protein [Phycisphaerales bacterium]MCI0675573.1 sulfite exporter TauE/SafE family protein [Phycisphaerales bacterium]